MLGFACAAALAADFGKITGDQRIAAALEVLDKSVLERILQEGQTQILFYELGFISYRYKDYYALTTDNNEILINAKYRNAPAEALAALIAHESVHFGAQADLDEEATATVAEITQWRANPYPDSTHPLVLRLNSLSELYDQGGHAAIYKRIKDNEAYDRL